MKPEEATPFNIELYRELGRLNEQISVINVNVNLILETLNEDKPKKKWWRRK